MKALSISKLAGLLSFTLTLAASAQDEVVVLGQGAQPAPGSQRVALPAPDAGPPVLVIYDVREWIEAARASVHAETGGSIPTQGSGEPAAADERDAATAAADRERELRDATTRLAGLVADFMEPALANGQEVRAIGAGSLVVLGTAPQQAWIRGLLDLQRGAPALLDVQATYLEGPRGCFREHVPEGSAGIFETKEARETFLAMAQTQPIERVLSPHLLVADGQRTEVEVAEHIPYIADWELVVVQPGAEEVADPRIETLKEGYELDVQALRLPDARIGLSVVLQRSWVERPIPTKKIRLSASIDSEVSVSTPASHTTTIRAKLVLGPQAAAVFVGPATDEQKDVAVVLTVEPVIAPSEPTEAR